MSLVYYTQSEINTFKTELNSFLSNKINSFIKDIEYNNIYSKRSSKEYILFCILLEIIKEYKEVNSTTDNIINTISEIEFQELIKNIYRHYNIK